MPLGIVSDDIFDAEMKHVQHVDINRGRGPIQAVPDIIREIVAEEAILSDKSQAEVAEQFGVSPSSVSAYKHGATSTATYNEPHEKLNKRNDKIRSEVISTARSRLLQALDKITPEKLEATKARDLAGIAKDMSTVISQHEPQVSNQNIGAQFVFHVPTVRKESEYEIIDVTK
jgi:predicted transcriptional regulator